VAIFSQRLLRGEEWHDLRRRAPDPGLRVRRRRGACERSGTRLGLLRRGEHRHGRETDVVELFRRINARVGGTGRVRHIEAKEGEVRRSSLDAGLAARVLGWTPQVSLDDGLGATVDFSARGRSENGFTGAVSAPMSRR